MASCAGVQEPLCADHADQGSGIEHQRGVGYVLLIQHELKARHLGLRQLESRTRINRARLGRILHRDQSKRHAMTLAEFRILLDALEIDPVQAIVTVELIQDPEIAHDERFAKLAVMLSTLFKGLPQRLVEALHELDGMDGSEIRTEWGVYFQRAVVNRMKHEVGQVLERRARMASDADPFSF